MPRFKAIFWLWLVCVLLVPVLLGSWRFNWIKKQHQVTDTITSDFWVPEKATFFDSLENAEGEFPEGYHVLRLNGFSGNTLSFDEMVRLLDQKEFIIIPQQSSITYIVVVGKLVLKSEFLYENRPPSFLSIDQFNFSKEGKVRWTIGEPNTRESLFQAVVIFCASLIVCMIISLIVCLIALDLTYKNMSIDKKRLLRDWLTTPIWGPKH